MDAEQFIKTWKDRDGNELGNSQSFLNDLCDLLEVPRPHDPKDGGTREEYSFERPVTFKHNNGKTSSGRIDLYRRGAFVLEAKQGSEQKARIADPRQYELVTGEALTKQAAGMAVRGTPAWISAMLKAKGQAYAYARALDVSEGWPPFLIVVDVGHVIDLYADFSGAGKNYTPFPDGSRHRIDMDALREQQTRALLRAVWMDPLSLDPTKTSARVTRKISDELAALGRSFHEQGHEPETTARFLMRCLFSMFAEDVQLIPKDSFTKLLTEMRGQPQNAAPTLEALWQTMDKGGFSPVLRHDLLRFNGGLFADSMALPLNTIQLGCLIRAAEQDWREVEPAIFGTLLERALSPKDRHKLGAHFTPRAYVERLVGPTVLEPLRGDWMDVQAAALTLQDEGRLNEAQDTVREFLARLCNVRVLDPACGSGNFLYIALEGMKRLEGEVIDFQHGLGDTQLSTVTVDPHQFLGIEKNPWAATVAELVLWIGYLQWHFRTFGKATPSEPVLRDFHNIETRDALLLLEGEHPRLDAGGRPVTRWDGETMKLHPVTGEEVPDEAARVTVLNYEKAKATDWPMADFIVGNPPFIGCKRMREALGDGYAETLWKTYPKMPESADFVMFWWHKAAKLAQAKGGLRRFGFITTNSLRQTFNRRVLEPFLDDQKKPLSLVFAIPDHPWVDSADGAAVRISMTVAAAGKRKGRLLTLENEDKGDGEAEGRRVGFSEKRGAIFSNLQTGVDVTSSKPLRANRGLVNVGVQLHGQGFVISEDHTFAADARRNSENAKPIVKRFVSGRDIAQISRGLWVIDFFGTSESEAAAQYPYQYQHLLDTVKPERVANRDKNIRENWWLFGRVRKDLREALSGLDRYIVSTRTSKHRLFVFNGANVVSESKLVVFPFSEAAMLSVLTSRFHGLFSMKSGAWLGAGNDMTYNHTDCFDPFPFPAWTLEQKDRLTGLGDRLDAHRKARQAAHPKLTLTAMYNVLEKLRAGEPIEGRDKVTYDQGLIGILKDLHDQIDAAVAEAYGWPVDLSDEEILERLVTLNRQRSAEEAEGHVRWLRPEYQNPTGEAATAKDTGVLDLGDVEISAQIFDWPKALPLQVAFVRNALTELGEGDTEAVARCFKGAKRKTVGDILESLAALGHVRQTGPNQFAA
ncbi:MAG: hypothetical protein RH945_03215 [Hyphomonas sp.]